MCALKTHHGAVLKGVCVCVCVSVCWGRGMGWARGKETRWKGSSSGCSVK